MTIEVWRDSPDPTFTARPLLKLIKLILLHAIRRVGDNRVETPVGDAAQPPEAIRLDDARSTDDFGGVIKSELCQMLGLGLCERQRDLPRGEGRGYRGSYNAGRGAT